MENEPCFFTSLPSELVEHIGTLAFPSDLLSLRLVSKEISATILAVFSKAWFSDRAFLLSDGSSMDVLNAISGHKVFAKNVQRIRFSPLMLKPRLEFGTGWARYGQISTLMEREDIGEIARFHHSLKAQEWRFSNVKNKNHSSRTVLKSIFNHFGRIGHYPDVYFIDSHDKDDHEKYRPWGLEWLRKTLKTDLLQCDCMIPAQDSLYHQNLHEAMIETQYAPTNLHIGQVGQEMLLGCLSYRPHLFPAANIRTLELTLNTYGKSYVSPMANDSVRRIEISNFAIFLSTMPRLTSLKLQLQKVWLTSLQENYADIFHCLATKSYLDGSRLNLAGDDLLLPSLKSIDLRDHGIRLDLLLHFCIDRRETLRTIHLERIVDHEVRDSSDVKQRIRNSLAPGSDNESSKTSISLEDCFTRAIG